VACIYFCCVCHTVTVKILDLESSFFGMQVCLAKCGLISYFKIVRSDE